MSCGQNGRTAVLLPAPTYGISASASASAAAVVCAAAAGSALPVAATATPMAEARTNVRRLTPGFSDVVMV